jgi:hypothetical protein
MAWIPVENEAPGKFVVAMNGGLDLFRREGACMELPCRVSYAEQIARSIALMADEVVMRDFIIDKILDMDSRPNANIDSLLQDIIVLKVIAPLIDFGLISFEPPVIPICSHCLIEIRKTTDQIVDRIYTEFRPQMSVGTYEDGYGFIDTGPLYTPPLYFRFPPSAKKEDDELIRRAIMRCVGPTMVDLSTAARLRGTVFSNSPIAMSAALATEGRLSGPEGLRALDAQRAGALPWVEGLSVEQTLELRQEAKSALPQLREFLAANLGGSESQDTRRGTTEADYVAQLREQAQEVRSELKIVTARSPRLAENSIGIASLGICAFGLLTDTLNLPTVGLGLMGIVAALRGLAGPHEEHTQRQKSRPGYVLIAAEKILQHAQ